MLRRPRSGIDTRQVVVLVLLAIVLTYWQHRARDAAGLAAGQSSAPERLAIAAVWLPEQVFARAAAFIYQAADGLGRAHELAAENARLREQNDELAAQKNRLIDAYFENQRIKRALGFPLPIKPAPLTARVVAVNYSLSRKRLTIAAPPGRELEVNNVVRTAAGLVGRIISVNGNRAQVFLLIDAEHAVAAMVQRPPHDQGMVQVATQPEYMPDTLIMDKLVGRSDIRLGDVIETSGLGGAYPRGIPIGIVTGVRRSSAGTLDLMATIRPFVDFDHLDYVLVDRHD